MNRRRILQALAAATAVPALPAWPALSAQPVSSMSTAARFWAIYLTRLHGDVTPAMLSTMTGIAPDHASAIRTRLIADKVIRPTGLTGKAITAVRARRNVGDPLRTALNHFDSASGTSQDHSEGARRDKDEESPTTP